MFIPIWLIFFASGMIMAICTVAWGIKTRQFEDQDRARYLSMADLSKNDLDHPPPVHKGAVFYGLIATIILGVFILLTSLIIVLREM
jgi:nitrogen fixation-related uncharacterized protein